MRLDPFLTRLDALVAGGAGQHPARLCFDLAASTGATVEFAGPEGQALGPDDWERWQAAGGPDPFVDHEGRATLRVQASHRITDWVVLNARFTPDGLVVEHRYTMLRSWVTNS